MFNEVRPQSRTDSRPWLLIASLYRSMPLSCCMREELMGALELPSCSYCSYIRMVSFDLYLLTLLAFKSFRGLKTMAQEKWHVLPDNFWLGEPPGPSTSIIS